jgi:TonB family protein
VCAFLIGAFWASASIAQEPLVDLSRIPDEADQMPIPILKVEPEYTDAARAAHINGVVVLSMVVDRAGIPQDIEVLRPLGYGLDQNALKTIATWRFQPAKRANQPVDQFAVVTVSFRLMDDDALWHMKELNAYGQHVSQLNGSPAEVEKAIKGFLKLAKRGMPEAAYTYGLLLEEGRLLPKDAVAAREWYRKAAKRQYPNAMARIALADVERQGPGAAKEALALLQRAADGGSPIAARWLGFQYLFGPHVEKDVARAETMFRYCAAMGDAHCRMWLGKVMLESTLPLQADAEPSRRQRIALAWLYLATAAREPGARELLESPWRTLPEKSRNEVARLAKQLGGEPK